LSGAPGRTRGRVARERCVDDAAPVDGGRDRAADATSSNGWARGLNTTAFASSTGYETTRSDGIARHE
jgi:hypothetical protein